MLPRFRVLTSSLPSFNVFFGAASWLRCCFLKRRVDLRFFIGRCRAEKLDASHHTELKQLSTEIARSSAYTRGKLFVAECITQAKQAATKKLFFQLTQ